jgi:hypothetical protein
MTGPVHISEVADDPSVTPDPVVEAEDERKTRLSVYHEIKRLLVAEGIPGHVIAFVHDYEGPAAQAELSRKLNAGEIRIVLLYVDCQVMSPNYQFMGKVTLSARQKRGGRQCHVLRRRHGDGRKTKSDQAARHSRSDDFN